MSIQTRLGNPHVTQAAKVTSAVLIVLGILLVVVGVFGYLMGDLNYEPLQPIAKEVYSARREARTEDGPLLTVDLLGKAGEQCQCGWSACSWIVLSSSFSWDLFVFTGLCCASSPGNMKDMFTVQPAVFFFLLFVYYPVIDLVRISFTDMRMLVADPQPFIGLKNYEWLF